MILPGKIHEIQNVGLSIVTSYYVRKWLKRQTSIKKTSSSAKFSSNASSSNGNQVLLTNSILVHHCLSLVNNRMNQAQQHHRKETLEVLNDLQLHQSVIIMSTSQQSDPHIVVGLMLTTKRNEQDATWKSFLRWCDWSLDYQKKKKKACEKNDQ